MGRVSDIQRFSTGDGPGIRTTVFLKGCNLKCEWCHNPETIKGKKQVLFYEELCVKCGLCTEVCSAHELKDEQHLFNQSQCIACGKCVGYCAADALKICGSDMEASDVFHHILEDIAFYRQSGGGVTLSGGEPLLQPEFCREILIQCKKHKIHTIVDTAGNVDFSSFEMVERVTDTFYLDLKSGDNEKLEKFTGANLTLIVSNLRRLITNGAQVIIRIPIIPDFNDTSEQAEELAAIVKASGAMEVHLIPFHRLGSGKYNALGLKYKYNKSMSPSQVKMQELAEVFTKYGLLCKIKK